MCLSSFFKTCRSITRNPKNNFNTLLEQNNARIYPGIFMFYFNLDIIFNKP